MPPPLVPGFWIPACIYIFTCTLPDTPSKNAATSLRIRCFAKKCWTFAAEHAIISLVNAGIVHRLVYQPSKLRRWVRFPLPAPRIKHVDSLVIDVFYLFFTPTFYLTSVLLRNSKSHTADYAVWLFSLIPDPVAPLQNKIPLPCQSPRSTCEETYKQNRGIMLCYDCALSPPFGATSGTFWIA